MVYYDEINSADSIVINISSYAKKNVIDITSCKKKVYYIFKHA